MRSFVENPDGSFSYFTAKDDMVDEIAFDFYGTHQGTAEHIYDANPGLSEYPIELPIGLTVVLPPFTAQAPQSNQVELWT